MMNPLRSEACWRTFKYFIIIIVSKNYIFGISWIIKCLSLLHGANMKNISCIGKKDKIQLSTRTFVVFTFGSNKT